MPCHAHLEVSLLWLKRAHAPPHCAHRHTYTHTHTHTHTHSERYGACASAAPDAQRATSTITNGMSKSEALMHASEGGTAEQI